MATERFDMALEDIIALNKKQRGRGRGRGGPTRARGRSQSRGMAGRGGGRGRGFNRGRGRGATPMRGGFSGGRGVLRANRGRGRGFRQVGRRANLQTVRNNQRQTLQASRQTARLTSFDTRRNIQPLQRGASNRGGRRKLIRPTGQLRGRGLGRRGFGRGQFTSQLTRRGNTRGRGRGRAAAAAVASLTRAKRILQLQQQRQNVNIQRGGGRRGGSSARGRRGQRGRGRGATNIQNSTQLQISLPQPPQMYEPEGVDLAYNFGAEHHTKQSLNNRFTPAGTSTNTRERLVLPNGRSVNYNSV